MEENEEKKCFKRSKPRTKGSEQLYKCMVTNMECMYRYYHKKLNTLLCSCNTDCKDKEKFTPVEPEEKLCE